MAEKAGVTPDRIRGIVTGRTAGTSFPVADRVVCALDVWIWHTPPEQGGLADLYRSPLL